MATSTGADRQERNLRLNRRQFVQRAVAVGAASSVMAALAGCVPLEYAEGGVNSALEPMRASVPGAAMGRVAFVRTDDRVEGARRAMALLGAGDWAGKSVLVKPNFNSADPAPGSTHPALLRTVLDTLHAAKSGPITIADRSGMGDTRQVMAQLGIDELAAEMGCTLVALDDLAAEEWEMIHVDRSHWQQGFPFPRLVRESDAVVQLCCLKTHRYGGHFTLSLKNSVGLAAKFLPGDGHNYMTELHRSPHQRAMIAEINAAYAPDLVIMDGVEAFVRGGPANGERVAANVMLAGTDRVALDAVGVALLRHFGTTAEVSQGPIFAQEQIARAVELGLGVAGPAQIELIADDEESQAFAAEILAILQQG